MYFGKLAMISYIFSVAVLAVAYIFFVAEIGTRDASGNVENAFGDSASGDALNTIIGRHDQSINATSTNPNFIFGDYLAAAQAVGVILFNVPTGGLVADVWGEAGGTLVGPIADPVYVLIRALITFSSACLIINIISGRDL